MNVADSVALVTGANRGLGQSLVTELLERGASKVYVTARNPGALGDTRDGRAVALRLDVTNGSDIANAQRAAPDVTLLINNAGVARFARALEAPEADIALEMATNFTGPLNMIRAFGPVIERAGGGAVVNVMSILSWASFSTMAGYSASKAALHSVTQALRPELGPRGVAVHGAYCGSIDTEMLAIDVPCTAPLDVARGILDGVEAGREDIFPDPESQAASATWLKDPKALEMQFAAAGG